MNDEDADDDEVCLPTSSCNADSCSTLCARSRPSPGVPSSRLPASSSAVPELNARNRFPSSVVGALRAASAAALLSSSV